MAHDSASNMAFRLHHGAKTERSVKHTSAQTVDRWFACECDHPGGLGNWATGLTRMPPVGYCAQITQAEGLDHELLNVTDHPWASPAEVKALPELSVGVEAISVAEPPDTAPPPPSAT